MKKMILGSMALLLSVTLFSQPQHRDGPPKPPPVAERWTHDSTRLQVYVGMSSLQTGNIKNVFIAFYNSIDALMQNNTDGPSSHEAMEKINKTREEALEQIFTAEQKIRYHAFRKELMPPPPPHGPEHKAPAINY